MKFLADLLLTKGAGLILEDSGDQASLRIDSTKVTLTTPTARDYVVAPEGVERFRVKNTSYGIVISTHTVPASNNTYDLGSSTLRFRNSYVVTGDFSGQVTIGSIPHLLTATGNVLVGNSGIVSYRTAGEILTDIGAMSATGSFYLGTTSILINRSSGSQSLTGISIDGNAGTATALQTGRTISISGDLTYTSPSFDGTGNVTAAGTLAVVNSNVGTFGSSTAIPTFTVNAKGLITAVTTNAVIAPAGTLTGTTLASNVVTSSLTSIGTLVSGSIPYSLLTGTPTVYSSFYLGTTSIALNRSSGSQTISGLSIDGNAATATLWNGQTYNGGSVTTVDYMAVYQSSTADWRLSTAGPVQTFLGLNTGGTLTNSITGNAATATLAANSTLWANNPYSGTNLTTSPTYVLGWDGSNWRPTTAAGLLAFSTETLATVTGRGASTSTPVTFNSTTTFAGVNSNIKVKGTVTDGFIGVVASTMFFSDYTNANKGFNVDLTTGALTQLGTGAFTWNGSLTAGAISGTTGTFSGLGKFGPVGNNTNGITFNSSNTAVPHIGTGFASTFIQHNNYYNGTGYVFDDLTAGSTNIVMNSDINFATGVAGGGTPSTKVIITNAGDVGIGTTTPLLTGGSRTNITLEGSAEAMSVQSIAGTWKSYWFSNASQMQLVTNSIPLYIGATNFSLTTAGAATFSSSVTASSFSGSSASLTTTGASALLVGTASNPGSYNAYFASTVGISGLVTMGNSLNVTGDISMSGTGYMGTNFFWYGRNNANNAWKKLIGFTSSDIVSIDGDGMGTVFGGSLSAGAISGTTATFTSFSAMGSNTKYFTMYDAVAGGELKYASVANVQSYLGLGSNAYTSDAYAPSFGFLSNANSLYAGGFFSGYTPSNIPSGQSSNDWGVLNIPTWSGNNTTTHYNVQFAANLDANSSVFIRKSYAGDGTGSWYTVLHSGNYGSYALPLTGGTLTGSVTIASTSYFIGNATYGFRFNNAADNTNLLIIADNGAATFAGAISGTTVTLSSDLTVAGTIYSNGSLYVRGGNQLYIWNSGNTDYWQQYNSSGTYGLAHNGSTYFTMGTTGAATFASSITSSGGSIYINGNSQGILFKANTYSAGHIGGAYASADFSYSSSPGDFVVARNQTSGYSNTNLILSNQNNGQIQFSFGTGNNDTVKAYFTNEGWLYAYHFSETSDRRYKVEIDAKPSFRGVEKISARLYEKNGRLEVGYYAQDVLELGILDHAVTKDLKGIYALSYTEVHTAKISRLEERVLELEKQVLKLGGVL